MRASSLLGSQLGHHDIDSRVPSFLKPGYMPLPQRWIRQITQWQLVHTACGFRGDSTVPWFCSSERLKEAECVNILLKRNSFIPYYPSNTCQPVPAAGSIDPGYTAAEGTNTCLSQCPASQAEWALIRSPITASSFISPLTVSAWPLRGPALSNSLSPAIQI